MIFVLLAATFLLVVERFSFLFFLLLFLLIVLSLMFIIFFSRGFDKSQFQSTFSPKTFDLEVDLLDADLRLPSSDIIKQMQTCVSRFATVYAAHTATDDVRLLFSPPLVGGRNDFSLNVANVKAIDYFGTQVGKQVGYHGTGFSGRFRFRRQYNDDGTTFKMNGADITFKREQCCRAESQRLSEIAFTPAAKMFSEDTVRIFESIVSFYVIYNKTKRSTRWISIFKNHTHRRRSLVRER